MSFAGFEELWWKILLAIFLIGTVLVIIFFVYKFILKSVKLTYEQALKEATNFLKPLLESKELQQKKWWFGGLVFEGSINGCLMHIQYRIIGMLGNYRYPYQGIIPWIIKIKIPIEKKEFIPIYLEKFKNTTLPYGGKWRYRNGWITWLLFPMGEIATKKDLNESIVEILKKLAKIK